MNTQVSDHEKDRIRKAASLLYQASRSIRVLRTIAWSDEVKEEFFAKNAQELPQVSYTPLEPTTALEAVREARRLIVPLSAIDMWLERQADAVEGSARMLSKVGTPAFFEYSRQLYGEPTAPLRYFPVTPLELSQSIGDTIAQLASVELDIAPPTYHTAEAVAGDIECAVQKHFGEDAPKVELVDKLSANALATKSSIRIRRDARFTDRDASQLLHHEAYVHVATSLNGSAQTDILLL